MRLIETSHFARWADSKASESRFPYFVKALILASIEPKKLRMPSGDAVWVPGFDGVVVSAEENRFVPKGLSMWELGTNSGIKAKAKGDYEKRTKNPLEKVDKKTTQELDRSEISFVFVTPRVWKDKDGWIADRKAEGIWKDVVAIDGVDLQDWLETAPAVQLQFAAEVGIVPEEGLYTPDQAWEEWSHLTTPFTSEELLVAGREEQEQQIIDHLVADANTFTIRGDSPREAWGFALAVLRRAGSEDERLSLKARTIVVDNEQVAGRLQNLKNLIILLRLARGQVSSFLSSSGSHVIVPEGNDARSERNVIVLSRPSHRSFTEALGKMGLPEDEAERVARACGLSTTIFQRQLASANIERPQWAEGQSAASLLPALLAGRWNERSDADRDILCKLANTPDYTDIENVLHEFLLVDEPPLQRIGEMWTLTAPVDAFQLMARRLTTTHMDRFKAAFMDVFGRIDPKVEIPPDEWLFHEAGEQGGHSGWLRSGMAETLLLIAERGVDAHLYCLRSPRAYAEDVVRALPGLKDDWRVLASIRDQYPRLIEAAPYPFLDSLERLLEACPDDLRQLYAEGEGIFGGGAMHTGLLWGLETLAWSPEFLSRVSMILAKLASIDPGGRLGNRPINSLREIFLWWHPSTNASLEERIAAIDLILGQLPNVGWELLAKLMPRGPDVAHKTVKPRWRDFGDMPQDARTRSGQVRYLSAIIDRVIGHVGQDPERWRIVLDSLQMFSLAQQQEAVGLLEAIALESTSTEAKEKFWEVVHDLTYKHRAFPTAKWALTDDIVHRLEAILPRLAPHDPVERNRWLFDTWVQDLPSMESVESNIKDRQREVRELRESAVKEVMQAQGLEGIIRLGSSCNYPGFAASVMVRLAESTETMYRLIELSASGGEAEIYFAGHISGKAEQLHGESWREFVLQEAKSGQWSPAFIASLLIWWPDGRRTWEDVLTLGEAVVAEYWRRKPIFSISGSPEDQTYQIDRLIGAGRAAEAFVCGNVQGEKVPTGTLIRLFDATIDQLAQATNLEKVKQLGLNSYHIVEFLDELRKREDLPREDLARREYQVLPLLSPLNSSGLTIHEFMADDPDFFVKMLCDVFPAAHRDRDKDEEPTPEMRARAQTGFSILQGMDVIPGLKGNHVNEDALLHWIEAVREKAIEVDRATIADKYIGKILAHTPLDSEDEGWPDRSIRNMIERLSADEIDRGLKSECYIMRGVVRKDSYGGGEQERQLASQYRQWAEISRARWPRTARVLISIAEHYEEDARREDIRAEQDKLE